MKSTLNLTTHTKLTKAFKEKLDKIIDNLMQNPDSFEFRQPVDYQALNLLDYPTIIKHPMDLGTILQTYKEGKYYFIEEALDDIQTIWDNCKIYNADNSWIYLQAEKLEKKTRSLIKSYCPIIPINITPVVPAILASLKLNLPQNPEVFQEDNNISFEDKLQFVNQLQDLQQQQVNILVNIIRKTPSNCFNEQVNGDCQLNIDQIDSETFEQLKDKIKNF